MNLNKMTASICLSGVLNSFAFAEKRDYGEGMAPLDPSVVLDNADGRYNHWTGLGNLTHPKQVRGCSSVLIDTREAPNLNALDTPAYVLTSGHCVPTLTGSAASDLEIEGNVQFNYFKANRKDRKTYLLKRVNWSSQQGIDLALVELDITLSELIADGIQPLRLSRSPVTELRGKDILTVSAPKTSTYQTMRAAACTVDEIADIVEQPYAGRQNLRHHCMDVLPGSSGGATLDRYTNEVVGIIGTTTRGATESSQCLWDSPCEVKHGQPTWLPDTNYSSPVHMLNACFSDGVFSPGNSGCVMQPSSIVTPANPDYLRTYVRLHRNDKGEIIPANWNFKFGIDSSHYSFKTTRNPRHCQAPDGYSQLIADKHSHIDAQIGSEPGLYSLCVMGAKEGEDISANNYSNAFIHTVELFADTPVNPPAVTVRRTEHGQNVRFTNSLPENVVHLYKFGPNESVQCDDPKGYQYMYAPSNNLTIPPGSVPITFCSMTKNAAGEFSAPRSDVLWREDDN